jgi:hypothetical protein
VRLEYDPHPAFANSFDDVVATDSLGHGRIRDNSIRLRQSFGQFVDKSLNSVRSKQFSNFGTEAAVIRAEFLEQLVLTTAVDRKRCGKERVRTLPSLGMRHFHVFLV